MFWGIRIRVHIVTNETVEEIKSRGDRDVGEHEKNLTWYKSTYEEVTR